MPFLAVACGSECGLLASRGCGGQWGLPAGPPAPIPGPVPCRRWGECCAERGPRCTFPQRHCCALCFPGLLPRAASQSRVYPLGGCLRTGACPRHAGSRHLQAPLVQVGWPALVGTAASAWEREVETVPPVSCAQVKGDPLTSGLGSFPVAVAPGCKPAGFRLEHRGSLPAAPAQRGRLWEKCLQSRSPSPQSLQVLLLMLSVVRAPPHLPELGWEPLRGGSSVSGASATADWPTGLSLNCAGCLFTWERGTEMRSPRFPPTDRSYTAAPGAPTSPLLAAKQCPRPSSVRRSCWPGRHLRESRAPCCPLGS